MPQFPGLVGKTFEEAKKAVLALAPESNVLKHPEGTPETRDYRPNRVRVIVNGDDIVVRDPFSG